MSRRECVNWKTCGVEKAFCILDDESMAIAPECHDYMDSGWRPRPPRPAEELQKLIAEKSAAFQRLKSPHGPFRFGEGAIAKKEAQRRRAELGRLRAELREAEDL